MTAEELLSAMAEPLAEDGTYCTIDPGTRVITIPPEYQLLGVESDEKAERLYFKCPKIVGDNIDLTKLALRVNFRNAGAVVDQYLVDDVEVDGDDITFSWLLSRRVTQYEGTVNFIVCAVKVSGEEITNEWNTTLAEAEVLEGLEVEVTLPEDETDIVNQLLALAETRLNDVRDATSAANTAASNANQKAQEAENAAEDARDVIEQITKDSYLHTALQSFIDTVTATPTAYGNAVVKKIEGFTRQEVTTGAQLFNINAISTQGSATYKIINDTTVEITGGKSDQNVYSNVNFSMRNVKSLIQGKKIYLYCKFTGDHKPQGQLAITPASGDTIYKAVWSNSWTEVGIPSDCENIIFGLYPSTETGTTDTVTFSDIKIGLTQFETWEPYTGGQPAPSPDYPQVIHGVGDMGFFDGEYQYVYHDNDNTLNNNPEWVSSINKVPCKTGDNIEIIYTVANSKSMYGIIYYKGDKFISALAAQIGNGKFTVPSGVDGFQWQVYDGSAQPDPSKVVVTINGMYAICVKMKGVNLCEGVESGAWLNASGNPIATDDYVRTKKIKVNENTTYKESSDIDLDGILKTVVFWDKDGKYIKYQAVGASIQTPANCGYMAINYYKSGLVLGNVRDVMIAESAIFPESFIPYQDNTTYIPISSPLFAGDQLIKRNMEHKTYRKMGFAVFDGDEDPINPIHVDGVGFGCTMAQNVNIDESKKIYSNTFLQIEKWNNGSYGVSVLVDLGNKQIVFTIPDEILGTSSSTGVDEAKTKIKEFFKNNKTIVCYTLQSPTEEGLTPEAQKAIHSIMACDEQTTIEIVGVPSDETIQNQFLLPRNEDGALNTTAYCTAEKNKIVLNELVAQNLDARVNKLEIDNAALAEQTIVVE